jgi:hypothetical protein
MVSKNAWRTLCSFINDLPRSARLHRALSRDPKISPLNVELNPVCYLLALLGAHHILHVSRIRVKLASFVAPSGRSQGETLKLLLNTLFPNTEVTQELAAPAAAFLPRHSDWRLAARVVTYRRLEWAIDSLPHIVVQGWVA